ncbi:ran-specific GTPase-activating protein-like [Rhodnius prolixus]
MSLPAMKNGDDSLTEEHDPHFEPIISLPEIDIKTMEEEETVLIQQRAKLFRRDTVEKEWKERGTGDVKLLHNTKLNTVRVVMRRDKTFKLCANHYVTYDMKLNPSYGSDRAWVWTTMADVSDNEPKVEILAIKFMNADAAKKWKDKFEEAKAIVSKGIFTCDQIDKSEEEDEKDDSVSDSSGEDSPNVSSNNISEDIAKDVSSLTLNDAKENGENKDGAEKKEKCENGDCKDGEESK